MKVRHYGRMAVLSMGCVLLLAPGIARAEHTKLSARAYGPRKLIKVAQDVFSIGCAGMES